MDPLLNLSKIGVDVRSTSENTFLSRFKYQEDHIDQDFISDLLVRFKDKQFATLFTINGNDNFLMCVPNKNYNHGFKLGDRIDDIGKEKDTAILVVQYVDRLSTGDYVVVKTMLDGSLMLVYNIYGDDARLHLLTALDRDIVDDDEEMLKILYDIVTGELETYKMNEISSGARYGVKY